VTTPNPDERFIERELAEPSADQEIFERLGRDIPDHAALFDFLAARERHTKRVFAIHAERAWFKHFGWRVIRPFMLTGVAAGLFFAFFQGTVDPTLGTMVFLGGAATLYVVIQLFAMFWGQRNQKQLPRLEADFAERVTRQLEQLRRDHAQPPS